MKSRVCSIALASLLGASAQAAPITVAGFTFAEGEAAFADDTVVVSGTVTGATAAQVQSTLVGSNVGDSIRVITPDVAVIDVLFTDNAIENGSGTDLVIFELSGADLPNQPRPPGYADLNERFEVSLFVSGVFTSFVEVIPVSTGILAPHDSTLAVYAVEVDLDDFGAALGSQIDRLQIRLVDHLVTRSADPTAFGALHSVPEPGAGLLIFAASALGLVAAKRDSAWTRARSS